MARVYTGDEIREALIVGIGLGDGELPADEKINAALDIFNRSHGREVPNYERFRELTEAGEWRQLAETHLVAAHMGSGEVATRHALCGILAASLAGVFRLTNIEGVVDASLSVLAASKIGRASERGAGAD